MAQSSERMSYSVRIIYRYTYKIKPATHKQAHGGEAHVEQIDRLFKFVDVSL